MAIFFGSDEVNVFCGQPSGGGTPSLQTVSKSYTPTESAQSESITASAGYDGLEEVDVTIGAIPSNYVGSGIPQRTSSNLTVSGSTVTASSGYYASNASKSVSAGTAGTPTASKGTVNNHAISVTPKVTNTTGYITGSTLTGTAVTVSASELVSGTLSISSNGTYDVTNYASASVSVSGGGGSSVAVDIIDEQDSNTSSTITFSGLQGEPTSFIIAVDDDLTTGTPSKIACVVFDGTDLHGQTITNTSNAQVSYDGSNFSKSYSSGTLTVTSTGASFQSTIYVLIYSYGGSAGNIKTADVQVGSGATSITFTGLEDEPIYWSCIFKSNFSTSSGYQRVVYTAYMPSDEPHVCGIAMDSSAHVSGSYWTSSYNNGSLTITSQGTNQGGYFHQPGYYQLTYVIADASPYEKKSATYRASTSAQTDKIEPSSGYDAMSEVNISIPAVTQTNLTADNIKSGTTVSISNGQSNLWSVTGTYGGGGTSKNTQVVQGSTRTSSATATAIGAELTVSKAGTYDVYWNGVRTSTSGSYTYGTQLYIAGSAYGSENTTWNNHVQTNHLASVSLSANQKIRVYGRNSRGSSYYIYAPQLTIVEA